MVEYLKEIGRWLKAKYGNSSPLAKVLVALIAIGAVSLIIFELPFFARFERWFKDADPRAQSAALIFGAVFLIYSAVALWEREGRVSKLKGEKEDLREKLEASRSEAESLRCEVKHNEEMLARLAQAEEDIWSRPAHGKVTFVPKGERRAKFVAMLNLKGGVGKTTLTANLAATLALTDERLRVLLVDLDFQGTLSNQCVTPEVLALYRPLGHTSSLLLDEQVGPQEIDRLAAPVSWGRQRLSVVIADDRLERADFRAQAQFFLNPECEVRYRFLRMHEAEVAAKYDLVIFDCPPRLTTSSVNALACSDYVLIPTRLDDNSVGAVPRTLRWMESLRGVTRAEVLGIAANEVKTVNGRLIAAQRFSYDYLVDVTRSPVGSPVFKAWVKHSTDIVTGTPGVVGAANAKTRGLFEDLAREFRERLYI